MNRDNSNEHNNDVDDQVEAARLAAQQQQRNDGGGNDGGDGGQQQQQQQERHVDVQVIEGDAIKKERERIAAIEEQCERHNCPQLRANAIKDGTTLNELRALILEARVGDSNDPDELRSDDGAIGMTDAEVGRFSFLRLMHAQASGNDRRANESAAFELDCARATSKHLHDREIRSTHSDITIPYDVLRAPICLGDRALQQRVAGMIQQRMQRDLVQGTDTAGGHLVATDLLAGSFIDILRDSSFVMAVATVFNDMVGDVAIPRQTAATTGLYLSTEQGAATEDDAAFDQLTLTPKEIGVFQEYSRKLLIQSSIDIEAFVRADLAIGLGLNLTNSAINGDGTGGAPTGIRSTSGIGSVVGGTNGAAPDWDDAVNLETEVSQDNALLGNLAYAVNAVTRGKFKRTFIDSGSGERIWDSRAGNTPVNGYPAFMSNQIPSNLTKGTGTNLSSIIFGNWTDLIIALWSGVDLLVNPYTGDTTRTTRITAYQDADVGVRHAESFSSMEDAITS